MNDAEPLERRVAALERSNRILCATAAVAGMLGAAVLTLGAKAKPKNPKEPGVVNATELRIVTPAGDVRAVLSGDAPGPSLVFRDTQGRERGRIGLDAAGVASMELADAGGIPKAMLAVGSDGSSSLALTDGSRQKRLTASVEAAGAPAFSVFDKDGSSRVMLSLEDSGVPRLKLTDADGRTRASLGATPLREVRSGKSIPVDAANLVLFDSEGRVIFKAPK
jgi:hypothetical protein